MEIPASTEEVTEVYSKGDSHMELVFESGTGIRQIGVFNRAVHAFVHFKDENDMKQRRRRFHLRTQDSESMNIDSDDDIFAIWFG
jgi:hypothetical protein